MFTTYILDSYLVWGFLYKILDWCVFYCCKKAVKINFREKANFTDPFLPVVGGQLVKNEKIAKKNTFEFMDQTFSKSGM